MTEPTLRRRAELFLAAHPRICAFEVAEGSSGLLVSATFAEAGFEDQRRRSAEVIAGRILRQWRFLYDRSYRHEQGGQAPNFDVWVSGFTGKPIPVQQMQAWLHGVLRQLRSVRHARVLDIGCGVGLVLAELAPGGVAYEGLDLSEEAIASLSAWAKTQPGLRHVCLCHAAAHEVEGRDGEPVELVIMNSVVQYFPDTDYLIRVLRAACDQLAPGGALFLGDLRANALLPMHAANLAVARARPEDTVAKVRAEALHIAAQTRELAVDPGFFQDLRAWLPRLGHVEFKMKPRSIDRELAGYRYDALLRLDTAEAPVARTLEARSLAGLLNRLTADRPDHALIEGIANARLEQDSVLAAALDLADPDAALCDFLLNLPPTPTSALEPEVLMEAAGALGYEVQLRFTPGASDGRFDALLVREGLAARWPPTQLGSRLTSDPLGAELTNNLRRELQSGLEAEIGGAFLESLDLTIATKVYQG